MKNKPVDRATGTYSVGIVREGQQFRAAAVQADAEGVELLWVKSSSTEQRGWVGFANECGVIGDGKGRKDNEQRPTVVAGFDSRQVVFYRLDVPAVEAKQMGTIVRLQAESRLPLPAEQMELGWRAGAGQDGLVPVTLAAGRREPLERFVEQVRGVEPKYVVLDSEAIVVAWRELFGGRASTAVIVNPTEEATQVSLVEHGELVNAVNLDIGLREIRGLEEAQANEQLERLAQDLASVLELFGCGQDKAVAVELLSDGSELIEQVATALRSAGIGVQTVQPQVDAVRCGGIGAEDLYAYRVAIGLAVVGLEGKSEPLNLFERLYQPVDKQSQKSWMHSPKITGALAAAMLLVFLVVSYAVDVASPRMLQKQLDAALSQTDIEQLVERQKLMKMVAQERPDMLELLRLVSESGEGGIKLNRLHFKKGQPVTITGEAPNPDVVYRFQENLLVKKGIEQVKLNATPDAKGGKVKFTINFAYKHFSRRSANR